MNRVLYIEGRDRFGPNTFRVGQASVDNDGVFVGDRAFAITDIDRVVRLSDRPQPFVKAAGAVILVAGTLLIALGLDIFLPAAPGLIIPWVLSFSFTPMASIAQIIGAPLLALTSGLFLFAAVFDGPSNGAWRTALSSLPTVVKLLLGAFSSAILASLGAAAVEDGFLTIDGGVVLSQAGLIRFGCWALAAAPSVVIAYVLILRDHSWHYCGIVTRDERTTRIAARAPFFADALRDLVMSARNGGLKQPIAVDIARGVLVPMEPSPRPRATPQEALVHPPAPPPQPTPQLPALRPPEPASSHPRVEPAPQDEAARWSAAAPREPLQASTRREDWAPQGSHTVSRKLTLRQSPLEPSPEDARPAPDAAAEPFDDFGPVERPGGLGALESERPGAGASSLKSASPPKAGTLSSSPPVAPSDPAPQPLRGNGSFDASPSASSTARSEPPLDWLDSVDSDQRAAPPVSGANGAHREEEALWSSPPVDEPGEPAPNHNGRGRPEHNGGAPSSSHQEPPAWRAGRPTPSSGMGEEPPYSQPSRPLNRRRSLDYEEMYRAVNGDRDAHDERASDYAHEASRTSEPMLEGRGRRGAAPRENGYDGNGYGRDDAERRARDGYPGPPPTERPAPRDHRDHGHDYGGREGRPNGGRSPQRPPARPAPDHPTPSRGPASTARPGVEDPFVGRSNPRRSQDPREERWPEPRHGEPRREPPLNGHDGAGRPHGDRRREPVEPVGAPAGGAARARFDDAMRRQDVGAERAAAREGAARSGAARGGRTAAPERTRRQPPVNGHASANGHAPTNGHIHGEPRTNGVHAPETAGEKRSLPPAGAIRLDRTAQRRLLGDIHMLREVAGADLREDPERRQAVEVALVRLEDVVGQRDGLVDAPRARALMSAVNQWLGQGSNTQAIMDTIKTALTAKQA